MASVQGAKQAIEGVFIRLAGERGNELTKLSRDTVQSVVKGIMGIAFLQAMLAGLGFLAMADILFLIWNIIVGLMNNVLKPILLAKEVEPPMAVIFIGAIGGMLLSGSIGLFVGAVVMVLGYTLFMDWVKQNDVSKAD